MPNATKIMLVQNIANMAVSLENSIALEPAIPLVVERADSSYSLESTVALQALINLSYNITSSQISVFLPVIPVCIKRLWVRGEVNIDSLRLLVNLSCCPDVVPHVLAAKTTVGLIRILDTDKIDALQRAVTWMLCLTSATEALVITSDMIENLIKDSKIDFPSTVYHSLYGTKGKKELENRAYEISLRTDEIGMKARQLSDSLTRIPKCYQSVSSLNRL
ncbi:hypothetical protein AB6A40_005321 [Gnathostoma spinigerum]|uniref:Armadillo repeat-containing protein 8 n=1 Tax=Gnathostoma spinigerum TaxID=75299 RepID=A0ABD6EHB0_9BILA